jgi:hypothetical protein
MSGLVMRFKEDGSDSTEKMSDAACIPAIHELVLAGMIPHVHHLENFFAHRIC